MIKKDWFYELKIVLFIYFIILLVIACISPIVYLSSVWTPFLNYIELSRYLLLLYPILLFIQLVNRTKYLPVSKKKLFFKGLIPWLIFGTLYYLLSCLVCTYLTGGWNHLLREFFYYLNYAIKWGACYMGLFLAILGGFVLKYGKQITALKAMLITIGEFLLVMIIVGQISNFISLFLQEKIYLWLYPYLFGVGLIVCLISFRHIEKIHH